MRTRVSDAYRQELGRLRQRVDELFERALAAPGVAGDPEAAPPGAWAPAVDAVETPEAYRFYAELPGVAREDIRLAVDGRRLELSGRRRLPREEEAGFLRLERAYGSFRRSFELAEPLDGAAVEARYERGVLAVTVPKRDAAGARRIPVGEGGGS